MADLFLDKLSRRIRTKKILKYIPKNGVICDIGCGATPNFLLDLNGRISEGWGIDKRTKTRDWTDKIKTIEQDLDSKYYLSLPENKFDCLLMIAVLEHFKFPEKILKEAYRILKPEGIIIITTPTRTAKPILEFLAFKLNLISKEEIGDHKHYFSKSELISLLNSFGFHRIQHYYFEIGFNQLVVAQKR